MPNLLLLWLILFLFAVGHFNFLDDYFDLLIIAEIVHHTSHSVHFFLQLDVPARIEKPLKTPSFEYI
jgi:hypothetical protein